MLKEVEEKGVIFISTEEAIQKYPDIYRKYFNTVVPYQDNKFSALNGAVFSGGTFIYVPKGVKLEKPLQSYFRINNVKTGQFERTLIIVDEGADVHYVEGCTAPIFSTDSLHAAVVEIVVLKMQNVDTLPYKIGQTILLIWLLKEHMFMKVARWSGLMVILAVKLI